MCRVLTGKVEGEPPQGNAMAVVSSAAIVKGVAVSFRENLQYLRSTRGLTQERLAVLLGVSRQAISKWESDRAYPEMDKLLTICDLFGCTLDELVTGDLRSADSGRQEEPVVPQAVGPVQDYTGYDAHMRGFAWKIAAGVSMIIAGAALAVLVDGLALGSLKDTAEFVLIALGTVCGLALLVPAGLSHAAFRREHPYVEDFYTSADRARAIRELAASIVSGIAVILGGIGLMLLGDAVHGREDGWWTAAVLFGTALGTGLLIRGGIRYWRLDVSGYNKEQRQETDPARRAASARVERVCGVIMLIATIIALTAMFLAAPWASEHVIARVIVANFWLAWVIGGLACGIAALVLNKAEPDEPQGV